MNLPYIYWRGRFCPLVEVILTHNSNHVRVLAYADTGATYSVFHSDYCEKLGIGLRSGKRVFPVSEHFLLATSLPQDS